MRPDPKYKCKCGHKSYEHEWGCGKCDHCKCNEFTKRS
jgi:hypothetical protein